MHALILGAAGMIGDKLTKRLVAEPGALGGKLERLTLVDVVLSAARRSAATPAEGAAEIKERAADLSAAGTAERLIADRPDVIFHLAAIVSGEAEADFEKGYAVNLDGTRALFEAIRREGAKPGRPNGRVVFASSTAVFGGPLPEVVGDEFLTAPLMSYGTQKAIGELLLADYSRRGFFDGIGLRLPTICIRPGKPNRAVSGFFSNILREPLAGKEAILPALDDLRHWFASPRSAVGFFIHAATLDIAKVGPRRNLIMPGLAATVGEEIEALRQVAGEEVVQLIRREPDQGLIELSKGWARSFDPKRALALGFKADASFVDIIRAHIEDEGRDASPRRP